MSAASSGFSTPPEPPFRRNDQPSLAEIERITLTLVRDFRAALVPPPGGIEPVARRIATEVERICRLSERIQASGHVERWQHSLAQHRLKKCLHYYQFGSRRGRVELHSTLSSIVYRHIAPRGSQLGFDGRYALLEDFLQNFYIEVLNAFRREQDVPPDYTPRTRLQLAEYMAFSEQYAKRRITLRGRPNQQLVVLRAQAFARRLPAETPVDLALAVDAPKTEEAELHARSSALAQVREQMVAEALDPADSVMRDRVVNTLISYLEEQNQPDCIDYLVLKLEDCSAAEIDEILQLAPRERDYLQQRFKYHVEKFSQVHHWELVHQWLSADLDKRLGMTSDEWQGFLQTLSPDQQRLVELKAQSPADDDEENNRIAKALNWTPKKVQRVWGQILGSAWKYRNQN